jgi:hypothetical protein
MKEYRIFFTLKFKSLISQIKKNVINSTTYHKAKALEPLMHRVIKLAK